MTVEQLSIVKNTLLFLVVIMLAAFIGISIFNYINSQGRQLFGLVNILFLIFSFISFGIYLYMRGKLKEKLYLKEQHLQ
ncbi:hypothetical protein [Alkalicoccus daliensis]|uniref:Uncharacterized protein n=1 Tax=Alkalicoccus daliensis TaxID=745820 RepID=A0A1G9ZBY1_9BACI|nr:hypothetical protein [Alkalicoccus daliensis]SDN18774.1 hypothetical protein SAMN04488053_10137 [Alkalicoccus daliensis]